MRFTRSINTVGGGAKTNRNGLKFEARTHLYQAIQNHPEYDLVGHNIIKDDEVVGHYFEKHSLYNELLKPRGINYKHHISKKLLPDGAILVGQKIFIIEKKYQAAAGSVDEKLQTCDFKKKQYQKLFDPLSISVEYYYILNKWFDQSCYKDVFDYIHSVGCKYFIEELPLSEIDL